MPVGRQSTVVSVGIGCVSVHQNQDKGSAIVYLRKNIHRKLLYLLWIGCIATLLLSGQKTFAADEYATWSNWRYVYLITTSSFAVVTVSTVTNFPVLLRFNPKNFDGLGSTSNSGADIRFAKTDGTHLPYAIETWTNYGTTNDTAEVWVLVDTIHPNDTTKLIMYWNNSGAVDSSASETVFSTSNNFRGTYHFTESSGTLYDASNAGFDGSRNGNVTRVAGRVGYGQSFDGTGDYVDMGDCMNPWAGAFTLSGWVKRGSTGSTQTIFAKSNGGNPSIPYGWALIFNTGNLLHFFTASGGTNWGDNWTFNFTSSLSITDANWHHFACVINRSNDANCKMYIDGADVTGGNNGDISTVGNVVNTVAARIGTESDGEYGFNGSLDESRIAFTDRSAAWVKLCYQNQRWDGTNDYFTRFSSSYWQPAVYTWDNSTGTGFTAHSNTWSTSDAYWSKTGTSLANWPGPGNAARFAGSDGNWTVTVSGTQYVDSIAFGNEGYVISGGTSLVVARKLSGPVFGSSPQYILGTGADSAKAFDGSIATFFNDNATDTGNTGIDLGAGNEERIAYIRYYPRSGLSEYLDRMNGGKFQGSNDGALWTDLSTISGAPTLAWQTVPVSSTTAWRYFRYLGPANGYCNVAEVEFFGMGHIYVESGKSATIATELTGNSGIRKYGFGSLTQTALNTYAGPTEIYWGYLGATTLSNGGSASSIGASTNSAANLLLNGGALRYIGAGESCDRLFTVGLDGGYLFNSGSGSLNFTNTGAIAFSGSGTHVLNLGGTNTGATNIFAPVVGDGTGGATSLDMYGVAGTVWALTGNNTYTGQTYIDVGTLSIGNGGTTGAISNSSNVSVASGMTLTFNRSNDYSYSGVISGAGAITKEGTGTVTLSGNLTHSGLTTVNDGTLRLTGTQSSNARKFIINTGGTISVPDRLSLSAYQSGYVADFVTLNGGTLSTGIVSGSDYGEYRGFTLGASGGTIEIPYTDNAYAVELKGVVTGSGALTKTGTGVLVLSGTNTFTGGVTVSDGVLRTLNTAALGNSSNTIMVTNGGGIDVYGTNLQAYTNDVTINGQVSSDTGALANFGSDQMYAIRKIALGSDASIGNNGGGRFDIGRNYGGTTCITGNGHALTKIGNNMVAILANGTGLSGVVVNGGTLRLEADDAVGTAPITINSGGEVDSYGNRTFTSILTLNGGTLGSVENDAYNTAWSGAVSVTAASTLACKADNTNTLSGAITGSGSLTVTGAEGVYILSGNSNTYSGGTTVSGATLRVTNTSGSATGTGAVSVADGAILDGTGSISGTVGMSGTLSPGTGGAGTLTIEDDITFTGSGILSVDANGSMAESGYDQLVVTGGVITLGSAELSFSLGYTPTIGDEFTIIDNETGSGISGIFSGVAQGDTITASYAGTPYDCRVSYTGGVSGHDVVVTVVRVSAEDYPSEWGYSQSILLNTTASGANVSGNVTNFPVLLRLNPGNFDGFANTQPGGVDIRFAKTDGTKLKYEIEQWKDYDNNADTAEIWVKLDTVYGNNKTQSFKMYWGKPNAADSSDAAAVFDTANGYRGVWHLNTSGTGPRPDATWMNDSARTGGTSFNPDGAIAGCDTFVAASSQYDSIASGAINLANKNITIMSWVKMDNAAPSSFYCITGQGTGATRQGLHFGYRNSASKFSFAFFFDDLDQLNTYSGGTDWHLVAGTFNTSDKSQKLYMDGVLDNSRTAGGNYTGTGVFRIGRSYDGATDYFGGNIDEVIVADSVRTEHWIKLCYENQKTSQTLVQYEDYTTWGFSRNITINTSGVTTTDCIDFPLLVRLTSSNFDFNQADDNGDDIRFSNADGTPLRYQIERWIKGSALAELWVRVDTVYGNNSSQYITMYWGKSGVSSKSSGNAVFDTSNNFKAVYHLDDNAGDGAGSIKDHTAYGWNGTPINMDVSNRITGTIGYGQSFDGSSEYVNLGNVAIHNSGKYVVSMWIKGATGQADKRFFSEASTTDPDPIFGLGTDDNGGTGSAEGFVRDDNNVYLLYQDDASTSVNVFDGTWNHVAWVDSLDGGTNRFTWYVNGESRGTGSYTNGTLTFTRSALGTIARATPSNYVSAQMDEVRLEKISRNADWIKLCYETQKPTPTIVTTDSADAFRPLTIRREMSGSTTDSIIIATKRWAIRFARSAGGGIDFLAADTNSTNQLDANLFYLVYNGAASYSGTGTLTLLDSSTVFARVRQAVTVSSQPFIIDYTVLGSGRLYTRVYTAASSALSGGLAFRIANNATASYTNIAFGSTAATCRGVAHLDAGSGKYDLIMAPYDLWSDADAIQTNSKYTGLASSGWSTPANTYPSWEFMVDFAHRTLTDSATAYRYVADYRGSDTLGFYAGTPFLNQAWEYSEKGEWGFDEGTGTTIADNTGHGHTATASSTPTWSSGVWNSSAVMLGGSDSIIVPHDDDFSVSRIHTISAWIKPDALLSSSVVIFKKYSSSGIGYTFTGGPAGVLQYQVANGGTPAALQSTTVLTPGEWYHVAAKLFIQGSDDYLALYINGNLDTLSRLALDSYFGTNSSDVAIGKEFNGVIDDVRFYTIALSEEELRAMYLRGYAPEQGMYRLRADNNNTLHCRMHGNVNKRFLPVLQISNYWASTLPTYVYVDGVGLTSGSDYYAALDDNRNRLTIGFNRVITGNSAIFIDDNMANGYKRTGETKKMYWGTEGPSNEYFWVKNTAGNYFGAASSNEWYLNWKMNAASIKNGEISWMSSSVTKPYSLIDTTNTVVNMIQGTDGYNSDLGAYSIHYSDGAPTTTNDVSNSFTYTVEESSLVRIRLRVNERQVNSTASFNVVSRWTIYPTGQFFRYDSIYAQSGSPTTVYFNAFINDQTNATLYKSEAKIRGSIVYSSGYPDLVVSWLSMKNASGYQSYPFDKDTIATDANSERVGFDMYQDSESPAKWNSSSVETVVYFDIHHAAMNTLSMDSIANDVQCSRFSGRRALSMRTGTLDSTTAGDFSDGIISGGDLNGDGFNEMEGAYILGASNNTVSFILPAHGDTCRFYPAFRITGYTAVNTPQYVFLYHGLGAGDTVALLEGYQYNSYVNRSTHELLVQIDSIFCDSVGIYISYDKTLAVKMSNFEARPGNRCDTIIWRTESEQENLGYRIERRIQPGFFDSVYTAYADVDNEDPLDSDPDNVSRLVKRRLICSEDTGWAAVNRELIPGAPSGVSHGPRDYQYIDRKLFNGIRYEYKLIAIDYNSGEEEHGPVAVMPQKLAPARFMLGPNYPNPFRYTTRIWFALPVETPVSLNIYTLQGRLVRRLITPDRKLSADNHQIFWDGGGDNGMRCAAGPYIYRLTTGRFVKARVMLMVR